MYDIANLDYIINETHIREFPSRYAYAVYLCAVAWRRVNE